ncbi:MAG: hypothetical protein IT361_05010 [Gemmatimonadaceae bacterium]|nr:hypothetical protein [Gemmatimonadaceae bacterium]
MIISLFADRRTPDVAAVAHDLARALAATWPGQSMSLFVDGVATRAARGIRFTLPAQPLPASVSRALAALRPTEHAVLAFVGSVTEPVITAFDLSQRILVLTDASVASLRAAQRTIKLCKDIGYTRGRVLAVVLLEDAEPVDVDAVRAALRRESFSVVPGRQAPAESRRAAIAELADRIARHA